VASDLLAYFDRKDTDDSQICYREGEPADTLVLVAAGDLVIDIKKADGKSLRVRRIRTHTVVGEMGFFRNSFRSASVSADGPTKLFMLTRANLERMRHERPDLASAFYEFIICVLADRLDIADREAAALEPLY
jgi:CRP-like cAMP-binding protein